MTEQAKVEPIKKLDTVDMTGLQRSLLLQLCDGMSPKDKGKARIYGRVFQWAASGDWADYDDWFDDDLEKLVVPRRLLKETYQLDADKKQSKAIVTIITDALTAGILPGNTLRKLDKIYRQIEGESLVNED